MIKQSYFLNKKVEHDTNQVHKKMKKMMIVITVLMCLTSINGFAQLKEVRGVQTRVVEYKNDEGEERHGFEFKNENSYPVWVEAELVTQGFAYAHDDYSKVIGGTQGTKDFTLKAGETYIWKCGEKMYWFRDYYGRYFVKYKAYKAE